MKKMCFSCGCQEDCSFFGDLIGWLCKKCQKEVPTDVLELAKNLK